jgi:restriction system protein
VTVPSYGQFIDPVLRYLAAHPTGAEAGTVYEAVADAIHLSEEDRSLLLPSGAQPVFKNRIGWAHDRLKRAGLSSSPKRGFWKLTDAGFALAKRGARLPEEEVERIGNVARDSRLSSRGLEPAQAVSATQITRPSTPAAALESPDERIEKALDEVRASVAEDLLERIAQAPPKFFESLVLHLLHAMGYGTSRDDLQRVGGSGDGGIDGIISLDRLGLEKVYVQAKRWRNSVGSPEIQGFMGALQLQGASKGVFLTTSAFTKDAREAAARAGEHRPRRR